MFKAQKMLINMHICVVQRVLYSMKHKPIAYILHFFPFFFFLQKAETIVLFFQKRFSLRLSTVETNQLSTVLKNLKIT